MFSVQFIIDDPVNVVGSSIAREADHVFYTLAGPEISVATTKAYSTQLVAGYLLALQFAKSRESAMRDMQSLSEKSILFPKKLKRYLPIRSAFSGFPPS